MHPLLQQLLRRYPKEADGDLVVALIFIAAVSRARGGSSLVKNKANQNHMRRARILTHLHDKAQPRSLTPLARSLIPRKGLRLPAPRASTSLFIRLFETAFSV